ncbi:MAG: Na+/H+ antiporter NhaA [Fimbriimonas sp.]
MRARPIRRIRQIFGAFQTFAQNEASGGILLLISAVSAMIWVNSAQGAGYADFWHTKFGLSLGADEFKLTLHHWINDALMALFFLVVGLEIKREVLVGELADLRAAALPIAAAIGGMLVPATIFAALNAGTPTSGGWGIPVATDIAFALGILALVGSRVSISIKVFLTALAIVDDIGAVLIIALFYSKSIDLQALLGAGVTYAIMLGLNAMGVRKTTAYLVLGAFLWVFVFRSGIHATIAGILTALAIPARSKIDGGTFLTATRDTLDEFEALTDQPSGRPLSPDHETLVHHVSVNVAQIAAPLQTLMHSLHPYIAYLVVPIFALANSGILLSASEMQQAVASPLFWGVSLGLVLGKMAGVTLGSWLAVRSGLARLPEGVTWPQIFGVSWLAGVGFTMSIFVTELAFSGPKEIEIAKLGILVASLVAGIGGYLILRRAFATPVPVSPASATAS